MKRPHICLRRTHHLCYTFFLLVRELTYEPTQTHRLIGFRRDHKPRLTLPVSLDALKRYLPPLSLIKI